MKLGHCKVGADILMLVSFLFAYWREDVVIAHITESVLVVSASRPAWLDESITGAYRVSIKSSADLVAHSSETYDLILIVAAQDNLDTIWQAESVRRRFPNTMIWLIADNVSIDDYRRLTAAGVEDILPVDLSPEMLLDRLKNSLESPEPADGSLLTQSFDQLAETLDLLHQYAVEPDFIYHALHTISRTYNLHGSVLMTKTKEKFNMHSLRRDLERSYFQEDTLIVPADDITYTVLKTRQPHLIDCPDRIPPYIQDVLPDTTGLLILPLIYRSRSNGLLTVASGEAHDFTAADIHIFKALAAHLSVALYDIHLAQKADNSTSFKEDDQQIIITAWERLATQRSSADIAATLREITNTLSCIQTSLVWLPADQTTEHVQDIISTHGSALRDAFIQYRGVDGFSPVWETFSKNLAPIQNKLADDNDRPMLERRQLFEQFGSDHLIYLPIVDSTRVNGLLIASVEPGCDISARDLSLLEDLSRTAGQALERMSLIYAMHEKSTRLEYLLEAISEGAFFIDENKQVTFCNQQFTEVTRIRREDVINSNAHALLQLMVGNAPENQKALIHLLDAINNPTRQSKTVSITVDRSSYLFQVDLTNLQSEHSAGHMWAGIVSNNAKSTAKNLINVPHYVAKNVQSSLATVSNTLVTLVDQSAKRLSHTDQELLQRVHRDTQRLQFNWHNMLQFSQLAEESPEQQYETIDAQELINLVLDSPNLKYTKDHFKLSLAKGLPSLYIDVSQTAAALAQVLYVFADQSVVKSTTTVALNTQDGAVGIRITNPTMTLSSNDHHNFKNTADTYNKVIHSQDLTQLALYVCAQVFKAQGGSVQVEAGAVAGTTLVITLNSKQLEKLPKPLVRLPQLEQETLRPTIGLILGASRLAQKLPHLLAAHYQVTIFTNAQNLIEKLGSTTFQLIMVDALLNKGDSLVACNQIQQRTKAPIIMLADTSNIQTRIQVMGQGISAYLSGDYTTKDMLLEIETVMDRQNNVSNLEEPLRIGDLYIDVNRREVLLNNKPLPLARIEYDLLYILATNAGRVLRHEDLLTQIWGAEYRDKKQYLWVNMSRLRKKVHSRSKKSYIHTRSGVGYYLQVIA